MQIVSRMPVRIKLTHGESLSVDVDIDEWNRAFRAAFSSNQMIQIVDARGRVLAINPHSVLYLEALPRAEAPAATPA